MERRHRLVSGGGEDRVGDQRLGAMAGNDFAAHRLELPPPTSVTVGFCLKLANTYLFGPILDCLGQAEGRHQLLPVASQAGEFQHDLSRKVDQQGAVKRGVLAHQQRRVS